MPLRRLTELAGRPCVVVNCHPAPAHVRFTPNSDIDCVLRHVRFALKAETVICARRCGVRRMMTMLDRLMIAQAKTSNNIIQKGLAFPRKQSASVTSSGR